MGRRKIDMVIRETSEKRHVTFSQRRVGLMKKASELCVISGAQIAIIASSPGDDVFAFGHPSTEEVIDRYLGVTGASADGGYPPARQFNETYSETLRELEEEKKKNRTKKAVGDGWFLWELPIEEMGLEELEQYGRSMEEMRKRVVELVWKQPQPPAPEKAKPGDLGPMGGPILLPAANQFYNPLEIPYWY